MKVSDEHFSYLINFLSNLEFVKDKDAIDKSIDAGAVIKLTKEDEVNLGNLMQNQEDFSFSISEGEKLYPNFKRMFHLAQEAGLSLFWGNVEFTFEGKDYFLFIKELNFKKGIGEQFKVSSKTVFSQLNGLPLRNYPLHPDKFQRFKSILEKTNISGLEVESYQVLLQEFKGLYSSNESSQKRLASLDLRDTKGFFLAESNSFNLFLNLFF